MKRLYIWTFVLLLAIYIGLVFVLPIDPQVLERYRLSPLKAQMLNLTVVVPIALIYLSAMYGFLRVHSYAHSIRDSKEWPYFRRIAYGLTVLGFSLPITSIFNSLSSYILLSQPQFTEEVAIVRNYVALAFTLAAMLLIAHGARGLCNMLKRRRPALPPPSLYSSLGPISIASIHTWLITSQTSGATASYLPNWLLVTTLAVPYAFTWWIGLQAVSDLLRYRKRVRGVIYQLAIDSLAKGVAVIIGTSVLIRLLTTLSGPLNRLHLTPLLGLIYALIAIYAVGYGLVARGARKLRHIEEA